MESTGGVLFTITNRIKKINVNSISRDKGGTLERERVCCQQVITRYISIMAMGNPLPRKQSEQSLPSQSPRLVNRGRESARHDEGEHIADAARERELPSEITQV